MSEDSNKNLVDKIHILSRIPKNTINLLFDAKVYSILIDIAKALDEGKSQSITALPKLGKIMVKWDKEGDFEVFLSIDGQFKTSITSLIKGDFDVLSKDFIDKHLLSLLDNVEDLPNQLHPDYVDNKGEIKYVK